MVEDNMLHTYALLIFLICTPFVLFIIHAVINRIALHFRVRPSNQKIALYIIVFTNVPILLFGSATVGFSHLGIYDYVYIFCAYNLIGYCYFHLFNMSETARRIKILSEVKKGSISSLQDVELRYDYHTTLKLRLERLVSLSQIALHDETYTITGRTLLLAATVIHFFRKILGFE